MKGTDRIKRFNDEVSDLKRSEQCKHNDQPILNEQGFYVCSDCGVCEE
jgi:hypothetical protein